VVGGGSETGSLDVGSESETGSLVVVIVPESTGTSSAKSVLICLGDDFLKGVLEGLSY
jgi:hypothetical protein